MTPFRQGKNSKNLILKTIQKKIDALDGMDVKMNINHYKKNKTLISIGS